MCLILLKRVEVHAMIDLQNNTIEGGFWNIMGLFDKIKEPVFLKEDSAASAELAALEELRNTAPPEVVKKLEKEIRNVKLGILGENQIAFELKNSHIPMYVLHDLYLEHEGLTAQIDYLVITRRRNFVIECKNLYGNIEVTEQGDFIRHINYNGKYSKERIYSPITQSDRHLALILQLLLSRRSNPIRQAILKKYFPENYRSVVVLANPKSILNTKNAEESVKDKVISADRLIAYIQKVNSEKGAEEYSDKETAALAHVFLDFHKTQPDYIKRYYKLFDFEGSDKGSESVSSEQIPMTLDSQPATQNQSSAISPMESAVLCPRCGSLMILRTAKKGDHAGLSFYGCSNYPKCRGIRNIDSNSIDT